MQQEIPVICGCLGENALSDSYSKHYVDPCALTDPLLSHLPAKFNKDWRIGDFDRELPKGYLKSIKENKNLLVDPDLHAYYDVIREITRGDLNSMDRFKKIIYINTGTIKVPKLSNDNNHQ